MDPSHHPESYHDPQRQDDPWKPATDKTQRLHQQQQQPYQPPAQQQPPYQQQPYAYQQQSAPVKPDKVKAIAIMSLVDGIINIMVALGWIALICTAPLGLYALVVGVVGIIYASKLLSSYPQGVTPNKTLAILQIVNIITGNVISTIIGIITLVFYDDPEVIHYYNSIGGQSAGPY
jgi:hypothetical protein